jgi:hypothetical protein
LLFPAPLDESQYAQYKPDEGLVTFMGLQTWLTAGIFGDTALEKRKMPLLLSVDGQGLLPLDESQYAQYTPNEGDVTFGVPQFCWRRAERDDGGSGSLEEKRKVPLLLSVDGQGLLELEPQSGGHPPVPREEE